MPRRLAALARSGAARCAPILLLALAGLLLGALLPRAAVAQEARAELFASGLSQPVYATAPILDPRLFVVERAGRIRVVDREGDVLATPFLDIRSRVSTDGERGLLGLAFPRDHFESGLFYVYYTNTAGTSVLSRFRVSGDADVADPDSEEVLLTVEQPFANHNGGTVAFGPEGFLWLGLGDGGSANDPDERAQDPTTLLGKMLRIDPGPDFAPDSVPVAGAPYRIPADNPFVGDDGTRDEIQALGLRNPYRFSFDAETGDLWIADVGQSAREEIDFQPAEELAGDTGVRNWGWDVMEGTLCNGNDPAPSPPCNDPSLGLPVHEYDHSGGNCSVTGGFVARGRTTPLTGLYFFGDFCSGRIWTLDPENGAVTERSDELGGAGSSSFELVGFGQGGRGELYVVLSGGEIWRILPAEPACSDGIDNDGDGAVDLDDPQCGGDPNGSREGPGCGLGFELAPALVGLLGLRRIVRARRRV